MSEDKLTWEFEDFLWPGVGRLRVTGTREEVHVATSPQDFTEWLGRSFRFQASFVPLSMEWTRFALGPDSGMTDRDVDEFRDALTDVMNEWVTDTVSQDMLKRSELAELTWKKNRKEQLEAEILESQKILNKAGEGNPEALLGMEEAIRRISIAMTELEKERDE